MKNKKSGYLKLTTNKASFLRATKVSIVVGLVLNIINSPQVFSIHHYADFPLLKITLTFLVPFLVSLYSSVMANREEKL